MLDALAALRLQLDWGADESLADAPLDRFAAPSLARAPGSAPASASAHPVAPAAITPAPQATTIPALMDELRALPGIALRDTATHFVPPAGDPAAGLVLIAEAPGADDDRTGAAFSGPAGALLDRVLASIGLTRDRLLLTHLAPWRPPGGRPLSDSEIKLLRPFAQRLLSLAKPRLVVSIGTVPIRALANDTAAARRIRGRLLQLPLNSERIAVEACALAPLEQWTNGPLAKQRLWGDLVFLQRALAKP